MKSTPPPFDEVDSLSLLAHKVAPRIFDLSSRQVNVSIRDQMVRAQQLVRDLRRADSAANCLLVVGMGAAGMTAALRACEAGFAQVCVLDVTSQPFSLFKGVHSRYVGPFMYEWPSPFHDDQSYPGGVATPWNPYGHSPLTWTSVDPLSADDFGKALGDSLSAWLAVRVMDKQSTPFMRVNVKPAATRRYVQAYADHGYRHWLASARRGPDPGSRPTLRFSQVGGKAWGGSPDTNWPDSLQPDYVILAAGMGVETSSVVGVTKGKTPRFWDNDGLKDPRVANQHVVVLGGGDGAIQDALRSLTVFHHPLSFIRHLEAHAQVRDLLRAELPLLLSADRQMRQHHGWSADARGFAMVDAACLAAAQRLAGNQVVLGQVQAALRQGQGHVSLLVRGEHFDKAYLLNRFVAYLLARCVQPAAPSNAVVTSTIMGFSMKFGTEVSRHVRPTKRRVHGTVTIRPTKGGKTQTLRADHVIVRFGIRPDSIPGLQLLQISDPDGPGGDSKQRTTISRVELPFVAM